MKGGGGCKGKGQSSLACNIGPDCAHTHTRDLNHEGACKGKGWSSCNIGPDYAHTRDLNHEGVCGCKGKGWSSLVWATLFCTEHMTILTLTRGT
jgi:hypothetical protein